MLTVLIVIHLMLVVALIGVVLLQKSEGGGLISSTSGFLSSRGTANVLSRTTALLAAGFFVTSLVLSWWASFQRHPASIINTGAPASQEAPAGTNNKAGPPADQGAPRGTPAPAAIGPRRRGAQSVAEGHSDTALRSRDAKPATARPRAGRTASPAIAISGSWLAGRAWGHT